MRQQSLIGITAGHRICAASGLRRLILPACLTGAAAMGLAGGAHAAVTQINISCVQSPTFAGQSFAAVGQYELIQGTITGEVDPADPQNRVIVDIQNAPRNAQGLVTYTADLQILRPITRALQPSGIR